MVSKWCLKATFWHYGNLTTVYLGAVSICFFLFSSIGILQTQIAKIFLYWCLTEKNGVHYILWNLKESLMGSWLIININIINTANTICNLDTFSQTVDKFQQDKFCLKKCNHRAHFIIYRIGDQHIVLQCIVINN